MYKRQPIDSAPTAPIGSAAAATEPIPPLLGVQSLDGNPDLLLERPTPAELEFRKTVERYSHADWAREQRSESTCDAAIRYVLFGSPAALPDDFLSHAPSHKRPPLSEIHSVADKGRLHKDDDGTLLLVRKSTPAPAADPGAPSGCAAHLRDDEPSRIYAPILMRPWIMQHATPPPYATLGSPARFQCLSDSIGGSA